jgi:hypothetical protein
MSETKAGAKNGRTAWQYQSAQYRGHRMSGKGHRIRRVADMPQSRRSRRQALDAVAAHADPVAETLQLILDPSQKQ